MIIRISGSRVHMLLVSSYIVMKNFLLNMLLSALAIGIAAYILPGVTVDGPLVAILVAIVLALINATVGRLLRVLALPLNVLTFGIV